MYRDLFAFRFLKDNKRIIYFDAACSYIKYTKTLDGILKYYTQYSCCAGDRQSSLLGSQLAGEIQSIRKQIGIFVGARSDDIVVFCNGTTSGINILVSSLDKNKISCLVVSDIEHNSNFLPQREYAKQHDKKLEIFPHEYLRDSTQLEKYIAGFESGFLFSCTHCSNITGEVFDIKKISDIVHKYGGYLLVDDAQYITHNEEKFDEYGIDFCMFSGHKIGGPTGIGVLIISHKLQSILHHSVNVGGGTIISLKDTQPIYKSLPYFFEGGVQDFAGILGLGACIEQISQIGISTIHSYVCDLQLYFLNKFSRSGLEVYFDIVSTVGTPIVTLIPKKLGVNDIHQYCSYFDSEVSVAFRTGTMCSDLFVQRYLETNNILRISFGIYNQKEEIDDFFNILGRYIDSCK